MSDNIGELASLQRQIPTQFPKPPWASQAKKRKNGGPPWACQAEGRKKGRPIAEPRVKNSRVRLVTSDREEEALQVGGEPFRVCRFTSDQGIPVNSKHGCYKKVLFRAMCLGGGGRTTNALRKNYTEGNIFHTTTLSTHDTVTHINTLTLTMAC